jgi:hypothetical protein
MSAAIPPPSDLDELLAALDLADASVRAIYLKLADNPDLAPEYEAGLRELLRKRAELAQQAGVTSGRAGIHVASVTEQRITSIVR